MKKTYKTLLAAVLVGVLAGPFAWMDCQGTTSGHYTDMLPNPTSASGVTSGTLYYNGYDWQMTTLGASQTPGDAISRAPMTVYQSTTSNSVSATTAVSTYTAISGQGFVGSTTFPAAWVASGRSIRITARGKYTTTSGQQSWTWGLNIGTTTVMSSSTTVPASISTQAFTVSGLVTIAATGNTGTVNSSYDIFATSAAPNSGNLANVISYSTSTIATSVDLTSQLTVNPTFNWGASSQGNNITFVNVIVEFLN